MVVGSQSVDNFRKFPSENSNSLLPFTCDKTQIHITSIFFCSADWTIFLIHDVAAIAVTKPACFLTEKLRFCRDN